MKDNKKIDVKLTYRALMNLDLTSDELKEHVATSEEAFKRLLTKVTPNTQISFALWMPNPKLALFTTLTSEPGTISKEILDSLDSEHFLVDYKKFVVYVIA